MPYQISVSAGESPLFRKRRSTSNTGQVLKPLFFTLDEGFPEIEVYTLTVEIGCKNP
jgi:hypothetical protein